MLTREDIYRLTCQETARLPRNIELEDEETLEIIMGKTIIYSAARGKLDILVDEKGQFSVRPVRAK